MRVILLHQYYKTPEEGGGIRSWYLCRALVDAGHEVEVVTSWNGEVTKTVSVNGYSVHYLPVHYSNHLGFFRRIWSFSSFFVAAYIKVSSLSRPDFIYAISTPLSIGVLAKLIRSRRGIPYFFEVGDLWPDIPVQMGYIRYGLLISFLKRLELSLYRSAKGIVAMSPAMQQYFHALGHEGKTICITNFADLSLNTTSSVPLRSSKAFTVAYTGTLGKANQLFYLISLAEEAQKRSLTSFHCLILGDGAEKVALQKAAKRKNLNNVTFLPHGSKEQAIRILKEASMVYLSYGPYSQLWTGSPNKYFDALATGRPVLSNFGGWVAEEIRDKKCGVVYNPTDPASFFDNYWTELQREGVLKNMGHSAQTLAKEKYSLDMQLPGWLAFLAR